MVSQFHGLKFSFTNALFRRNIPSKTQVSRRIRIVFLVQKLPIWSWWYWRCHGISDRKWWILGSAQQQERWAFTGQFIHHIYIYIFPLRNGVVCGLKEILHRMNLWSYLGLSEDQQTGYIHDFIYTSDKEKGITIAEVLEWKRWQYFERQVYMKTLHQGSKFTSKDSVSGFWPLHMSISFVAQGLQQRASSPLDQSICIWVYQLTWITILGNA